MEIRFACIEFNTKSGSIWRPSPEKPNYLCDPKREIDIGSFGSWTSALNGEHIPLHWFVDGKPRRGVSDVPPFHNTLLYRVWSAFKKEILKNGRPLLKFKNLKYLEKFNVILVCFHFVFSRELTQFLKEAKERYPEKVFLVTYGTFNFGRVREYWRDTDWYKDFMEFLNAGDIFILVNKSARDYFRLVTEKPIVYFPTFYPTSYTKKYFLPREKKEKKIFIAGTTERMDIVWSCLLAKKLQERFPEFTLQACNWKNMNLETLNGSRVEVLPWLRWEDYLKETGKAFLILNTDTWWTNGRVPSDAAAVGTPCIGVNADRQMDLFPDLIVSEVVDTRKALQLGSRLIEDENFYTEILRKALQNLAHHSYERANDRLGKLLDLYQQGKLEISDVL